MKRSVLFVLCLATSIVPFMGSSLNLALPFINKSLSLDVVTSGWIPASYMLSTAVLQVPFARIADMLGRRKIFVWGVLVVTLFSVLSAIARSGAELIVYRFLSGIGSAMMFGTNMAIVTLLTPAHKRGRTFGIITSTIYASLAAGPLLGGLLTQYFGWRSIFIVVGLAGLAAMIGTLVLIKDEWKEASAVKFDKLGSLLYTFGMFAIIYGFSRLPAQSGITLIFSGAAIMIAFVRYELRFSQPVFNMKEFMENRVFRFSTLSALINYAATFAITFMLSLYLQDVRGLSPRDAGLILVSQSLVMMIAAPVAGRLSDKFSASGLATAGMGVVSAGLVGLCFITASTSLAVIIVLLIVLGIGIGMFSSPNTNVIMSSVEKAHYGMASATTGTMRLTGQAMSMGIALMAMSLRIGNVQMSPDVADELVYSMRIVFIICTVLCLGGVFMSSVRRGLRFVRG
jgi:MFS family permease